MKLKIKILAAVLLIIISFCSTLSTDKKFQKSDIGKIIASEKKTWIDDSTGFEITQWTTNGKNYHPYFTVESFIDENTVIIFSERTGTNQLYKLNLINGEMIQMTDAKQLGNIDHLPKFKKLWYFDGTLLKELNTETLRSKDIYDFQNKFKISSFSITCDAQWFVFSTDNSLGRSNDGGYGPYTIYKLNLADTSLTKISADYGFNISHIHTNPTDPNLILYCWQWEAFGRPKLVGYSPIRIWWININGTNGGPVTQPFGMHRTHETWTPDGKFITYSGDFRFGSKVGKEVLGLISLDGSVNEMYDASVWHAHQNMFKDNRHWVADLINHDERYLMLFERGKKAMKKKTKLFYHGSSWTNQANHPHPRFSPNGRYVLFSTDKSGIPQVYTVKINLDTKNNKKDK